MITELVLIKIRTMIGMVRSEEGRLRVPVFGLMSLIFAIGLYRTGGFIIGEALDIEPVGQLIVHKLLSITMLVFFALLLFSNVVTAFSSFYLADDLEFLWGQPIPKDSLFISRFLESLVQSSWIVIIFGMPLFLAAAIQLDAPLYFYPLLLLLLLPFVTIPTALASILALLVTNIIAANRTRDAALFFGLVVFATLFVLIRSFQPERLLNPDSFDSIGEVLRLLSVPSFSFMPNDWVVNIITPMLFGIQAPVGWSALLLFSTPLALFFIATWLHRPLYFRGYSNTQEGRHGGGLLTVARNWMLARSSARHGSLEEQLQEFVSQKGEESSLRQMVKKDQAIFVRDASQWSQILIVVAIIIIYLVNFKYFEIAAEETLIGDVGLLFFNLAACGFVVVAICGRFLFPAISLEGRAFWLILQAPISLERFLYGKWLGGILPVIIIGQLLIWSSNLLVGMSLLTCLVASIQVLLFSLVGSAAAVSLGAVYPQFHNPNAAKIASSFGAVIFMIATIFLILFLIASWFHITLIITGSTTSIPSGPLTYLFALFGLALATGLIPLLLKFGAYSLRKRF